MMKVDLAVAIWETIMMSWANCFIASISKTGNGEESKMCWHLDSNQQVEDICQAEGDIMAFFCCIWKFFLLCNPDWLVYCLQLLLLSLHLMFSLKLSMGWRVGRIFLVCRNGISGHCTFDGWNGLGIKKIWWLKWFRNQKNFKKMLNFLTSYGTIYSPMLLLPALLGHAPPVWGFGLGFMGASVSVLAMAVMMVSMAFMCLSNTCAIFFYYLALQEDKVNYTQAIQTASLLDKRWNNIDG